MCALTNADVFATEALLVLDSERVLDFENNKNPPTGRQRALEHKADAHQLLRKRKTSCNFDTYSPFVALHLPS